MDHSELIFTIVLCITVGAALAVGAALRGRE